MASPLRRWWSRLLWGVTGPPTKTPTPETVHYPPPTALPDLHPDRFASLTPEERAAIHTIEKHL